MKSSRGALVAIASLTCLAVAASCLSTKEPLPGEVMVVVTTDMAPEDIDFLSYSVGVGDMAMDAGSGTFEAGDLPATLGIASGPETTGPVLIELKATKGGSVRVHREASLNAMPTEGLKMLSMPLDWLCSEANDCGSLPCANANACAPGMTCRAGACVKSAIDTSQLPTYVSPQPASCTDAVTMLNYCFASAALVAPNAATCSVPIPSATINVPMNVALVLNPDLSSGVPANYPKGKLILLEEGIEGWKRVTTDAGTNSISLPAAVCGDIDGGQVLRVAVTTACPSLCTASVCIASRVPATIPVNCDRGTLPFACSEAPKPGGVADPQLPPCSPIATLNYCCQPYADALLIDDMSNDASDGSSPRIKVPVYGGNLPGHWFATSGAADAGFSYTFGAACLSFNGQSTQSASEGFNFLEPPDGGRPAIFDAGAYAGVSFYAYSSYKGQQITVGFHTDDPTCDGGLCDWGLLQSTLLTNTWMYYQVPWPEGSDGRTFDPSKLVSVYFSAPSPALEICVSQIYFWTR